MAVSANVTTRRGRWRRVLKKPAVLRACCREAGLCKGGKLDDGRTERRADQHPEHGAAGPGADCSDQLLAALDLLSAPGRASPTTASSRARSRSIRSVGARVPSVANESAASLCRRPPAPSRRRPTMRCGNAIAGSWRPNCRADRCERHADLRSRRNRCRRCRGIAERRQRGLRRQWLLAGDARVSLVSTAV